jgi:hypothetical protein
MLIAGVVALCIVLAILGVPRLSDHARCGADKSHSAGKKDGDKSPPSTGLAALFRKLSLTQTKDRKRPS